MNFCSQCGQDVTLEVPDGDNRPRYLCHHCGTIHYQNPLVVVGCVPEYGDDILLCRRSIKPRSGFWTVPAGFMELDESLAEAAARETLEEACAQVELGALIAVVDVVHAKQVHMFFAATLPAPEFGPGAETLDARLFAPDEIPWDEIAFPSVRIALEQTLKNRAGGPPGIHLARAPHLPLR